MELFALSVKHQTDKAVLIEDPTQPGSEIWLPLSQIKLGSESGGGLTDIEMPAWLAEKKGLLK